MLYYMLIRLRIGARGKIRRWTGSANFRVMPVPDRLDVRSSSASLWPIISFGELEIRLHMLIGKGPSICARFRTAFIALYQFESVKQAATSAQSSVVRACVRPCSRAASIVVALVAGPSPQTETCDMTTFFVPRS
jgi:hypothetical protein